MKIKQFFLKPRKRVLGAEKGVHAYLVFTVAFLFVSFYSVGLLSQGIYDGVAQDIFDEGFSAAINKEIEEQMRAMLAQNGGVLAENDVLDVAAFDATSADFLGKAEKKGFLKDEKASLASVTGENYNFGDFDDPELEAFLQQEMANQDVSGGDVDLKAFLAEEQKLAQQSQSLRLQVQNILKEEQEAGRRGDTVMANLSREKRRDLARTRAREKRERNRKSFEQARKELQTRVYGTPAQQEQKQHHHKHDDKKKSAPSEFLIYKVPAWPFYALPYEQKDLFQVNAHLLFADDAYKAGGRSGDLSKLVFGPDKILLQDVSLVSRVLLEDFLGRKVRQDVDIDCVPTRPADCSATFGGVVGDADPSAKIKTCACVPCLDSDCQGGATDIHKLALMILANHELDFHASMEEYRASINYARHFFNGRISFGFQVPIVYKHQSLKLVSKIDGACNKRVTNRCDGMPLVIDDPDSSIQSTCGCDSSLNDLVTALLNERGIEFNRSNSETGVGDITTFLTGNLKTRWFERFNLGASVLFPTASGRDTKKLWDVELGNGGFTEFSAYTSMLVAYNRACNPHFHVRVSYSAPASVPRRVSNKLDISAPEADLQFKCIDELKFGGNCLWLKKGNHLGGSSECDSDDLVETTVPRFGRVCADVKINRGAELYGKIGNIFELACQRRFLADLWYDLRLKGRDYLGFHRNDCKADYSTATKHTYEFAQRLGGQLSYQFNDRYRVTGGSSYVIGGRSVPKALEFDMNVNIEF